MSFPSIYEISTSEGLQQRIDALSPMSQPIWGKMDVSQMLLHCAIRYKPFITGKESAKASFIERLISRIFFKRMMTGESDMRRNRPTGKAFIVTGQPEFMRVRDNLKDAVALIPERGESFFEGLEHPLFGRLSAREWSNLLYKHLDHHLRQFGV